MNFVEIPSMNVIFSQTDHFKELSYAKVTLVDAFARVLDANPPLSLDDCKQYFTLLHFANKAGIAEGDLNDKPFYHALWILYLRKIGSCLQHNDLKYRNVETFKKVYWPIFADACLLQNCDKSSNEAINLYNTANCMAIFLDLRKSTRCKSDSMAIVPRVIEGWSASYVTGGEPTCSTRRRMKIFEHESGVLPKQRKSKQSSSGSSTLTSGGKRKNRDAVDLEHSSSVNHAKISNDSPSPTSLTASSQVTQLSMETPVLKRSQSLEVDKVKAADVVVPPQPHHNSINGSSQEILCDDLLALLDSFLDDSNLSGSYESDEDRINRTSSMKSVVIKVQRDQSFVPPSFLWDPLMD